MVFGTPLGLLLSLVGLLVDGRKRAAIWGIAIGGSMISLFLLTRLC